MSGQKYIICEINTNLHQLKRVELDISVCFLGYKGALNGDRLDFYADYICGLNREYYSRAVLDSLPTEYLQLHVNEETCHLIVSELDRIRAKLTNELASSLGYCSGWRNDLSALKSIDEALKVNSRSTTSLLTNNQRGKVAKIRFLFNLASTILHG